MIKRLFFILLLSSSVFGQDDTNKKFRIEIEPAAFALKGVSGSLLYNISETPNLSLGLFLASVDVPLFTRPNMFENVGADTSDVRLGFQAALMARFSLPLFKEMESNPYIGLIAGWEYFDIKQPYHPDPVRLTTYVLTPYLGYEFYFYKQMLFLNPQLRGVVYLGAKSDTPSRKEALSSFLFLPQISIGIRL